MTEDDVKKGKGRGAGHNHHPLARKQSCVALEDSDAGVLSASAAGMKAICIPDLKQPSDAARKAAWRVLDDLTEARNEIALLLKAAGE